MTDNRQAALELGQKPVGQLLWQYALPAIVAMTASSLYNIIDRAMIGQIVGPEAIYHHPESDYRIPFHGSESHFPRSYIALLWCL